MTIDRAKNMTGERYQLLVCDTCGDQLHNEDNIPWREFWEDAKDRGWRTLKVDNKFNNWIHACPTCDLIESPPRAPGCQ